MDGLFESDQELVSGNARDGMYESSIELPALSEQGTWHIEYFLLVDQVGNYRYLSQADLEAAGFPTQLVQAGPGDQVAPELKAFDFSPKTVDTSSSPATVTLSAHITDLGTGVADSSYTSSPSQVRFASPSGQIVDGMFESDLQLVSGTPQDGLYESTITLPVASEQGTWKIDYFLLVDQVGNTAELQRLGPGGSRVPR